jgi:hypothetical protein
MDVLHGRRTVAEVRRTVDYHLDRIFTVPSASRTPVETSQEVHLGVRQASRQ